MLGIFDLIFTGVMLLSSITLYSTDDYEFPTKLTAVVPVSGFREWWRSDGEGKCEYRGLMIPYTRDWEEVRQNGDAEEVIPADSTRVAGHAFLYNQRVCKGKEAETLLRGGDFQRLYGKFQRSLSIQVGDLLEAEKPDNIPNWFPQVYERIKLVAQTDPAAADFLKSSSADLEKVLAVKATTPK